MDCLDKIIIESIIEKTKNWLINSGIQNLDSNKLEIKGGFNCWYDLDKKDYFYTYSEISGYAISTLLFLNTIEKKELYILRAILAAEWLLDKASHKGGGLKSRYYNDRTNAPEQYDFSSGIIHSFDNGMALKGLMDIYKLTKELRYLGTGKKIGDFLVDVMQKEDGSFYASYSHKNKNFEDNDEKWSTQSGSYHAKISLGLLELYNLTKDEKYKESAIKVCDNSLMFQKTDGRFISYQKEGDTHLHPHCYSAEGLIFSGLFFNNKDYLESASKATKWVINSQMDNGGIPSMFVNNRFINVERSDILAQTLRLGVIMRNLNLIDKKYEKNLSKLENRLRSFQYLNFDQKNRGGFFYGEDIDDRNNLKVETKNHLNSWCSFFALQSLIFYKKYIEGDFHFDKTSLI